ncbi:MAG TPA: Flp family type IVb pilin [Sphingomicrobium sp.]|nr:Flp family type IVb pilin [Sphingomicrobium sp.]
MGILIKMLKDRSGASAAEYALILAIVGSAIALAAFTLGRTIGNAINSTDACISSKGGSCS